MTLSPSSAARRVACAGSHRMEQRYPQLGGSKVAEEGTIAHALAAKKLEIPSSPWDSIFSLAASDEMIEAVDMYVHDVISTQPILYIAIEQTLDIRLIHPDCRGTPDCWVLIDNDVYIWDFKYGHSPVEVYENWQLLEYAAGVIEQLPQYADGTLDQVTFHLRVVQPRSFHRDGPIREWVISGAQLWQYVERLRIVEAAAMQPDALCTPSPQCNFCSARRACPALHSAALAAVDVSVENQPDELTSEQVGFELKYLKRTAKLLDARVTGLEQQAFAQIKRGDRVPYFTLESGRGSKQWKVPAQEIIAMGTLLGHDLAKPAAVVTPTQAKKLGLSEELINQFSEVIIGEQKLIEINEEAVSRIFNNNNRSKS